MLRALCACDGDTSPSRDTRGGALRVNMPLSKTEKQKPVPVKQSTHYFRPRSLRALSRLVDPSYALMAVFFFVVLFSFSSFFVPFVRIENTPNNDNNNFTQAVVYSEGILYLDDCDFSGSAAAQLVEGGETTVVRNAVLGDDNCE